MKYGYARVSTKEQKEARQIMALMRAGITQANIFIDRQSGKNIERSEYQKLLRILKKGDVIYVQSIDRLGRNYQEIREQWRYLTKQITVDIVVLDMPLLNTQSKRNSLTDVLIADLVLEILSYVAQTEREFIRKRQAEGIAAAKQRGVRFGRKPMKMPGNFEDICQSCSIGDITIEKASNVLGMKKSTFYQHYKRYLERK